MTKILVVEDEADILDLTVYGLRREGFVVIEARDGVEALRRWSAERPDLIVLDLGLPGIDGFEVLREIRAQDRTPVLVLTGQADSRNITRTFSLGTDDFIAKPFEFREFTARIRAILRRSDGGSHDDAESPVEIDGLRLIPGDCEIQWTEGSVRLTPIEFRLLYLLVTNAGQVVSANRLYTYVWGSDGADANALRSHLSHLRRKLGDQAPGMISSVPAVGYIFRRGPARAAAGRAIEPPLPSG